LRKFTSIYRKKKVDFSHIFSLMVFFSKKNAKKKSFECKSRELGRCRGFRVFALFAHCVLLYNCTQKKFRICTRKNGFFSRFFENALLSRRSNLKILSKSRFSRKTKKTQKISLFNPVSLKNDEKSTFFLEGEFSPSSRSERRNFSILAVFFFIFFQLLGVRVERTSYQISLAKNGQKSRFFSLGPFRCGRERKHPFSY